MRSPAPRTSWRAAGEPRCAGSAMRGASRSRAVVGRTAPVTDLDAARALVARVRATGGTVVATGGVFDPLHRGHTDSLAAARALGDCLLVLVNSDASARRRTGAAAAPLAERVAALAAAGRCRRGRPVRGRRPAGRPRRGGYPDFGTLFAMTTAGDLTILHHFAGSVDGFWPLAPLVQAR